MQAITMQIRDNETQRIFFLIRGRTDRCWEGFERSRVLCVCVAVGGYVWELAHARAERCEVLV